MALILSPPIIPSSSFTTINHLLHPKPTAKFSVKSHRPDSSTEQTTSGPDPTAKKPKGSEIERSPILRREPFGDPSRTTPQQAARADELRKDESAFLIALSGLVAIIILQGILLAASGFLPEAWDKFLVKYLYPSFTPTVFLFVAGTVAYGVLKYSQNRNSDT